MHILYKVTFLPHLNTNYPKYYVGSKHNYKGNYYGSVASTQIFDYTNGIELRKWWKIQLKNKQNFKFEIIQEFEDITPIDLVNEEYNLHIKLDVLSNEYFNQTVATKGWVSLANSASTKKKKSEKTKAYWDSEGGKLKKERLSERNRQTKSEEMKERWKNEGYRKTTIEKLTSVKMTDERKQKIGYKNSKDILYKGIIYRGGTLEKETGVTAFLYKKYYLHGYDPEINIKSKTPIYIPLEKI